MSLSITQKLVLCFVGVTVLVLVATLSLARWSFHQGFLDYVNALEQVRLERLARDLAKLYRTSGNNWTQARARFDELHHRSLPPPPGRPPPPFGAEHSQRLAPTPRPEPPPPPDARAGSSGRGMPTALFDATGERIAGSLSDSDQFFRVPVVVDEIEVGDLRSSPKRHLDSPQETTFARQQLTASLIIGIIALVVATAISLLLARALLSPVRRMMTGVAALSSGDYSVRLLDNRQDELGQLTKDLDRLAEALEQVQSSRRRWLADISHELRTPVTILAGELEAIKDGVRSFDADQLRSFDQEVQRLRRLIDDLYQLALSDLGALRYQFAPLDLVPCLESWLYTFKPRAERQSLEITVATPETVWIDGDENRFMQLFVNLGDNALAYTDAPGRINVVMKQAAGKVSLVFEDTAPSVDATAYARLFDPLYRLDDSRSRRAGGAGLGLAICQNIVHAHGGTIDATPSTLGGIAIKIVLPARGASTA